MSKTVIIVQPRLTEGVRKAVLEPRGSAVGGGMKQLDTLLLATQTSVVLSVLV